VKRLFLLILVLSLTACTLYIEPGNVTVRGRVRIGIALNEVIRVFEPTRGNGAIYRVGEDIAFRVYAERDGFLALTEFGPDGRVTTFARNIFVRGGQTSIITGPDSRSIFSLIPPRGLHYVRASFTPFQTDTARVTYQGITSEDAWTQSIVTEIRPYEIRDIAETSFFLE
jgi:hypothetical protein